MWKSHFISLLSSAKGFSFSVFTDTNTMTVLGRLIVAFVFLISALHAGEDDQRNDGRALYLFPHEAIQIEEIQLLDSETRLKIDDESGIAKPIGEEESTEETTDANPEVESTDTETTVEEPEVEETGPKSLDTQIREAEGLLRRYYSQFLSEKRIWEDKNRGSKFSTKNDQNEVRLLMDDLKNQLSESKLIRDSELVYYLHRRLGRLHSERENYSAAVRHLQAALQYRNLSNKEDYFLNESTWKEVINQNEIPRRQAHLQAWNQLKKSEDKVEESQKKIHRIGADFAKGKMNFNSYQESKKTAELALENDKKDLLAQQKNYEDSYRENYIPYQKSKSREDAETFYELAILVRKLEDTNKERLKIVNKTSFAGRGVFVLFDYKRNTGFSGYEYLLEIAYKLDPSFPPPIKNVADQFKIDGQKIKAIDYYKKYLELMSLNKDNLSDEEREDISKVYLNLAILNSDIKRKVQAADYYEKFIKSSKDQDKLQPVYFELGRFYEKQIGNYSLSKNYYEKWLSGSEAKDSPEKESVAYYGLSLKEKQNKRADKEEEYLLQSYERYKLIRKSKADKESEIVELEREINRYKRELLITTNDESLAQFRILQLRLDDLKLEKDTILTKYKSIPHTRVILRLAEINEDKKELNKSISYYQELIDIGNESEVNYALKNIKRLELTQSDGIKRKRDRLY
ncbi:MAG: hypothetical protein JJT78_11095 [Leptospira sp.]|nr:hypothetical protein [Leptospira sp.]